MTRLQFDVLDLIRSVRGFERPDGYAVIPNDLMRKIEGELERLYAIEDTAVLLLPEFDDMAFPTKDVLRLRELMGVA